MGTATEPTEATTIQRATLALIGLGRDGRGSLAVEQALIRQGGVCYAYVCTATEMAYVVYDPMRVSPRQLVTVVEQIGFHAGTPALR